MARNALMALWTPKTRASYDAAATTPRPSGVPPTMPLAAALNGHAFAGGALLALAADYRVMRSDRGWFCLPEIDIQVPFAPPMMELLKTKLSPNVLRDAVLTGRRYTAEEGIAAGIVDKACTLEKLEEETAALLRPLSEKGRVPYTKFKKDVYGDLAKSFGHEA